ncbi:signal peptidase I [Tersicoccus phoenicis]|uniref:signal peptidase I n=1 Tax=Tersicoccus phoenicis TaxID=554083 RepID=UPI0009FDB1B0|nr:signal peptidase I [Tersicoccus phoenicis]
MSTRRAAGRSGRVVPAGDDATVSERQSLRGWRSVLVGALAVVLLTCLLRAFVLEVYTIPSASMEPGLVPGDRIAVARVGVEPYRRGDVVVFDGRGSLDPYRSGDPVWQQALAGAGQFLGLTGSSTVHVKRILGVPGDRVTCCGTDGRLRVDGQPVSEPYLAPGTAPSSTRFDVVVPAGSVWLLGDNRGDSYDSRALLGAPGGGMVPMDRIIGTPVARVWPLDRAGALLRIQLGPSPG